MNKNIKAILFDSGKVLNGPTTGHWFISPEFFLHIKEKEFKAIHPGCYASSSKTPQRTVDNKFLERNR
jgi:hypothetical protein